MNRFRAYAELLRIPNVFTALADVSLGWLCATAYHANRYWTSSYLTLGVLLLTSACLYCAGMVLNDYFDVEEDRKERPHRPIPSGRVSHAAAGRLAVGLLVVGILLATACAFGVGEQPFIVMVMLVGCIIFYDGWAKSTRVGPIVMGSCRFLNVLLGCAATGSWPANWMIGAAALVGLYIIGVTVLAGTETTRTSRLRIAAAWLLMLMIPLLFLVVLGLRDRSSVQANSVYIMLMATWALSVSPPIRRALAEPSPTLVQAGVKRCIIGLIGLDAVLAIAVAGVEGVFILLLLAPAVFLGRWVYST